MHIYLMSWQIWSSAVRLNVLLSHFFIKYSYCRQFNSYLILERFHCLVLLSNTFESLVPSRSSHKKIFRLGMPVSLNTAHNTMLSLRVVWIVTFSRNSRMLCLVRHLAQGHDAVPPCAGRSKRARGEFVFGQWRICRKWKDIFVAAIIKIQQDRTTLPKRKWLEHEWKVCQSINY